MLAPVGLASLVVSASVIAPDKDDDDVVAAFASAPPEGVRVYFVTSVHGVSRVRKITLYDPATRAPVSTLDEFGSYILGYSASLLFLTNQQEIAPEFVTAEDTVADVPALLKPITGRLPEPYSVLSPPSRPVGVAGTDRSTRRTSDDLLPQAIAAAVERRVPERDRGALVVTLRDKDGAALWSTRPDAAGDAAGEVSARVPFVFKDLTGRAAASEPLARRLGAPAPGHQRHDLGPARPRPRRRHRLRPADVRAPRDGALADEDRLRLERLARAAHAARLHSRLRRVPPAGLRTRRRRRSASTASTSSRRAGG